MKHLALLILIGLSLIGYSQEVTYTYQEINDKVESLMEAIEEDATHEFAITYSKERENASAYIRIEDYTTGSIEVYYFKDGLKKGSETYYAMIINTEPVGWRKL